MPPDSKISVDSNPNLFMSLLGFSDPVGIVWIRARTLPAAGIVRYHPETVQSVDTRQFNGVVVAMDNASCMGA
jgi:hypothetical protein